MNDFQAFKARIEAAATLRDVERLSLSLDRLFNAGIFNPDQLARLDLLIIEKHEALRP
jgi:hypothetical protein